MSATFDRPDREVSMIETVGIWGLPVAVMTRAAAVARVADLIRVGRPSFFVTANTHYAMLSAQMPELRMVNERAAFLVADGYPLVWASRIQGKPLPERVAGSDLIFDLCNLAAREGHRVYFHGGAPGVADSAAERLARQFPGLVVAGTECPPFRALSAAEHEAMLARIRNTRPEILFVASSMPKGELWLAENFESLGVPVVVNVGASLDFAAGRVQRAPRWVQRLGMEWAFRMSLEPRRLAPRYARNGAFLIRMVAGDLVRGATGRQRGDRVETGAGKPFGPVPGYEVTEGSSGLR
jgi:N-acetylglucosaminyldiphosphoundecaprenol N-acetyl-beta-D-mannosaminyltransferase